MSASKSRDLVAVLLFCMPVGCASGCAAQAAESASTSEPTSQASSAAGAGEDSEKLAMELSNPVASLISAPFQNNFDFGLGPNHDGFRYTLNVQPVAPFSLTSRWNLISRTILPVIHQHQHQSDAVGTSSQTGLGDITQSLFFSPKKVTPFIWGVGPALLLPTATDDLLGTGKFGLGPTAVALQQAGGWTYGALANHIWSVAGASDRTDVNSTFLQPFLTYTTRTAWTFGLNTEAAYNWESEQWSVPIHVFASKVVTYGKRPVSYQAAVRCWATSPANGPRGCGFRLTVTPLFPKGNGKG